MGARFKKHTACHRLILGLKFWTRTERKLSKKGKNEHIPLCYGSVTKITSCYRSRWKLQQYQRPKLGLKCQDVMTRNKNVQSGQIPVQTFAHHSPPTSLAFIKQGGDLCCLTISLLLSFNKLEIRCILYTSEGDQPLQNLPRERADSPSNVIRLEDALDKFRLLGSVHG